MDKENLGVFLSDARAKLGWTRAELSEKSGISTNYIYDIEKARGRNPSHEVLFRLAQALGVDPREVFRAGAIGFPLEEKPEKFITVPYDFPLEALHQIEDFVKFLQYREEFAEFLKLYHNRPPEYEGTIDEFVEGLIEQEKQNRKNVS